MDLGIKGKTAIVCGASKGLGFAIAEGLAAEGVSLAICARQEQRLFEAAEAIEAAFRVSVFAVAADLSLEEDRARFASKTVKRFGGVDILVNNAGGPPPGGFESFGAEDYRRALELNLLPSIDMTKRVVPFMKKNRWGRIVNLTSIAVKQPIPDLILSNTARTALIGFAKTAATELASKGVTINNVCPGTIFTDRIKQLTGVDSIDGRPDPNSVIGRMAAQIPAGRMGRPEELAALVVFLCSERASYITGTTIQVDGGMFTGLM